MIFYVWVCLSSIVRFDIVSVQAIKFISQIYFEDVHSKIVLMINEFLYKAVLVVLI